MIFSLRLLKSISLIGILFINTFPDFVESNPVIIFISVDLPAPFEPVILTLSPPWIKLAFKLFIIVFSLLIS